MATVIRFSRHGTKKKPFYRMVVQNNRSPRDGRFIENIGVYNPLRGLETLLVKRDRLQYWLSVGAKMSDSVRTLVKHKMKEWQTGTTVSTPTPVAASAEAAPKKKAKSKEKEA